MAAEILTTTNADSFGMFAWPFFVLLKVPIFGMTTLAH